MVKFDVQGSELLVSFYSKDRFEDLLESARYMNLRFDPKRKVWIGDVPKLVDYVKEFSLVEPCEASELTKKKALDYCESLKELKQERRRVDFSFMKYPPIIGKHPYEDFQREDIRRFFCSNRGAFVWPTGAGKSYAISTLYANYVHQFSYKKALIFSSPIGLLNIRNELLKFTDVDPKKILVVERVTGLKERDFFRPEYDVVIIGYETMKFCQEYYYSLLHKGKKSKTFSANQAPLLEWLDGEPGQLYMDEVHYVGNYGSRRSKCIDMVVPFFEVRYWFSATPWDECAKAYYPLKFLDKALVEGLGYQSWLAEYYSIGTRYSRYAPDLSSLDLEKEAELNGRLYKSYGVSRKKEEILDIPPQYEVPTIRLAMSSEQRAIYESFSEFVVDKVVSDDAKNGNGLVHNLMNSFAFAMLAVENPTVISHSERFADLPPDLQKKILAYNYEKHSTKLDALDSILEEECDDFDRKVLVFYTHPRTLEALKHRYRDREPFVIQGGMTNEARMRTIEEVDAKEGKALVLASLLVANSAVNLQACTATCFLERTFQYQVYLQGKGRTSRATSTEESRVYNFRYDDSIDALQLRNLETKGAVVENIMKKSMLRSEEWRDIFNGRFV